MRIRGGRVRRGRFRIRISPAHQHTPLSWQGSERKWERGEGRRFATPKWEKGKGKVRYHKMGERRVSNLSLLPSPMLSSNLSHLPFLERVPQVDLDNRPRGVGVA